MYRDEIMETVPIQMPLDLMAELEDQAWINGWSLQDEILSRIILDPDDLVDAQFDFDDEPRG